MSTLDERMLKLRQSVPQGSDNKLLKRVESREAFPESDPTAGKIDMPGDLGEVAFPQSDRMDAEEALLKKIAGLDKPKEDEPKKVQPTPKPVKAASAVVKESRKRRSKRPRAAPQPPSPPPEEEEEDTGLDFNPLVVSEDEIQLNEAVKKDHGEELSDNDILDILDQHEKDIRGDMSDEDREEAAGIDYGNDSENSLPTYKGSGPSGTTVEFYDNPDGGPPKGYMIYEDGSVQVVTGMLFPPGYRQ